MPDTRGPWGQQVWQKIGDQRFFGMFWSGMPDLNYRNPEVTAEAYRIADFWLQATCTSTGSGSTRSGT